MGLSLTGTNIEWDKQQVGQSLSGTSSRRNICGTKIKLDKNTVVQTQVAKTLGGTNIKSDIQWGKHWMGQTLNGTNSKWKNNESDKHRV